MIVKMQEIISSCEFILYHCIMLFDNARKGYSVSHWLLACLLPYHPPPPPPPHDQHLFFQISGIITEYLFGAPDMTLTHSCLDDSLKIFILTTWKFNVYLQNILRTAVVFKVLLNNFSLNLFPKCFGQNIITNNQSLFLLQDV